MGASAIALIPLIPVQFALVSNALPAFRVGRAEVVFRFRSFRDRPRDHRISDLSPDFPGLCQSHSFLRELPCADCWRTSTYPSACGSAGLVFNFIEVAQIALLRIFAGQPQLGISAMVEQIHYRLMRQYSKSLKQLLVDAFERQALVLFSLASRKVYCGVIFRVTSLMRDEDQFIEVVPMFSAYRNKDTLALEGHLDYQIFHIWRIQQRVTGLKSIIADIPRTDDQRAGLDFALEELRQLEEVLTELAARAPEYIEALPINDWVKIIPFSEIETTSIYDEAAYDAWFKMPAPVTARPDIAQ